MGPTSTRSERDAILTLIAAITLASSPDHEEAFTFGLDDLPKPAFLPHEAWTRSARYVAIVRPSSCETETLNEAEIAEMIRLAPELEFSEDRSWQNVARRVHCQLQVLESLKGSPPTVLSYTFPVEKRRWGHGMYEGKTYLAWFKQTPDGGVELAENFAQVHKDPVIGDMRLGNAERVVRQGDNLVVQTRVRPSLSREDMSRPNWGDDYTIRTRELMPEHADWADTTDVIRRFAHQSLDMGEQ